MLAKLHAVLVNLEFLENVIFWLRAACQRRVTEKSFNKKFLKHQMDPSFSKITTKTFDSMVYYTIYSVESDRRQETGDGMREMGDGRQETGEGSLTSYLKI